MQIVKGSQHHVQEKYVRNPACSDVTALMLLGFCPQKRSNTLLMRFKCLSAHWETSEAMDHQGRMVAIAQA